MPADEKATVQENSTVLTLPGYHVKLLLFTSDRQTNRMIDDTIGAYSTILKLVSCKCNIPKEKEITAMVITASSHRQLVL